MTHRDSLYMADLLLSLIHIFDQDDYEVFLQQGRIIATLRNAIVNHYDGFEVYYQPIAVSYTHLDVSKRQSMYCAKSRLR